MSGKYKNNRKKDSHLQEIYGSQNFLTSRRLLERIVRKLTENANPPSEIWLVMEKGAAKRFLGVPVETKYSLSLKHKWKPSIVYFFKKEDFHPKPSVDSVLLHFLHK